MLTESQGNFVIYVRVSHEMSMNLYSTNIPCMYQIYKPSGFLNENWLVIRDYIIIGTVKLRKAVCHSMFHICIV